jgi:hypothetical protein
VKLSRPPVWHIRGTDGMDGISVAPMRQTVRAVTLRRGSGAGEGNRTLMTSLEGWGSAIELRPRGGQAARCSVPFS